MLVKAGTAKDAAFVAKCLKRQGIEAISEQPSLVVPGVAAANINAIEGIGWLMSGLVTNSLCSGATRNAALNSLYAHITANYSPLIAWSSKEDAIARAEAHGFKRVPTNIMLYQAPKA